MNIKQLLIGAGCLFALSACGQQVGQPSSQGLALSGGSDPTLGALHSNYCVYTQGFYKNHPTQLAAALQRYASFGVSFSLEQRFYGSQYTWGNILRVPPKKGDAYLILAHQFVTAVANGLWREWPETVGKDGQVFWEDTHIGDVQTAYRRARFFFEQIDPFNEGAKTPTREELIHWASILDKFNNGALATTLNGQPSYQHCG